MLSTIQNFLRSTVTKIHPEHVLQVEIKTQLVTLDFKRHNTQIRRSVRNLKFNNSSKKRHLDVIFNS